MDLEPLNEQEQALADKDVADRQKMQSANFGRKKVNPSKSRQGRAVLVNGCMRNPHWTPPQPFAYGATGRNPGTRRHTRTLKDYQIQALKHEAGTVIEAHNDYAQEMIGEMDEFEATGWPDLHLRGRVDQHLSTLLLASGRAKRRAECEVSRQLNRTWRVGAEESFTVEAVDA